MERRDRDASGVKVKSQDADGVSETTHNGDGDGRSVRAQCVRAKVCSSHNARRRARMKGKQNRPQSAPTASAAPPIDCAMPWDRAASSSSASQKVRAVAVSHNLGFIGNKLFAIAAGVSLAETLQLPLAIPPRTTATMTRKGFPCLRSSPSLRSLPRTEQSTTCIQTPYSASISRHQMKTNLGPPGRRVSSAPSRRRARGRSALHHSTILSVP